MLPVQSLQSSTYCLKNKIIFCFIGNQKASQNFICFFAVEIGELLHLPLAQWQSKPSVNSPP